MDDCANPQPSLRNRLLTAIFPFLLLFVLLQLVLALQLIHTARVTSATWDEPHHLFDGYTVLTARDYSLNPEVPPLLKITAALPLLPMKLNVPPLQGRSVQTESFTDGRTFVFSNGGDRVLFPARMAAMLYTLTLGLLIFLAGRQMFGSIAAFFALALFVFDPNFLAHGALVTTDVACSCLLFATIYAWYRYTLSPSWISLSLTAIAAGLTLSVKFTGILIFPALLLLIAIEAAVVSMANAGHPTTASSWPLPHFARSAARSALTPGTPAAPQARWPARQMLAFIAIAAVSFVILWSFYSFRYAARPNGLKLNPTLAEYVPTVPSASDARHLAFIARHHLLPEAYIWGLANTKLTEDIDTSYFFGHVYRHGNWMYFPAAFLIKSTLPLVLMLALVPLALFYGYRKHTRELLFLTIPVAVYLFVALRSDMNIGMRHILPLYPFFYVLAAGAAVTLIRHNRPSKRLWIPVFTALLLWQVITSLRVAPAYMAYANEAWGGPSQVHRYLSDANSDWAQQLKEVKTYLDQRHITNCWIVYFADGAILPSDYGIPCKRLPTTSNLWWLDLPIDVPPVIDGTVLISDSNLESIEFGQGALNPYESFRSLKPTAAIQYGLFVYDGRFPVPLASALVHAHKSQIRLAAGDVSTALSEAQFSVALAPQSVYSQTALGDVLSAQHNPSEALLHYQAALHSAQTIEPELQAGLVPGLKQKIAACNPPR